MPDCFSLAMKIGNLRVRVFYFRYLTRCTVATAQKPPQVDKLAEMIGLARIYRKTDPYSSMLHCRRALEAVVHHLCNEKFPMSDSYPEHLAKKISFLNLERPGKYFAVNRITSSWIHWTPKGSQDNSEIGTCIRLMGVILKEVFGLIPEVDSNECTIMDSLVKALSESGQTVVLGGDWN